MRFLDIYLNNNFKYFKYDLNILISLSLSMANLYKYLRINHGEIYGKYATDISIHNSLKPSSINNGKYCNNNNGE